MGCLTILIPLAVLVGVVATPLTWWQGVLVLFGVFVLTLVVRMKRDYGKPGGYWIDSVERRRAARRRPAEVQPASPSSGPSPAPDRPVSYTSPPRPSAAATRDKLARLDGFITQARNAGGQRRPVSIFFDDLPRLNLLGFRVALNDFVNSPALRAEDAVGADEVVLHVAMGMRSSFEDYPAAVIITDRHVHVTGLLDRGHKKWPLGACAASAGIRGKMIRGEGLDITCAGERVSLGRVEPAGAASTIADTINGHPPEHWSSPSRYGAAPRGAVPPATTMARGPAPRQAQGHPAEAGDLVAQLERLTRLHESHALSDAEFEQAKRRLLGTEH